MLIAFSLFLTSLAQAQVLTNVVWPPRDSVREVFGRFPGGLALHGDRLVVSDYRIPLENPFLRVYRREGSNWIEAGRLSIAPRTPPVPFDCFGCALDVEGDMVVASSTGTVHIFKRFGPDWERRDLLPPDPSETSFGADLALDRDSLAIATGPGVTDSVHLYRHEPGVGFVVEQRIADLHVKALDLEGPYLVLLARAALFVYERSGTNWIERARLPHPEPVFDERRMDLGGDRLVVYDRSRGATRISFYERTPAGSWTPAGGLPAHGGQVALAGDHAFLGSVNANLRNGLVHHFVRTSAGWQPGADILPADLPAKRFGISFGFQLKADGPLLAVLAATQPTEKTFGSVSTFAFDGTRATLHPSQPQLALEDGGTLTLSLDAGVEHAGQRFVLAGSLSGTSPGFRVRGTRIPLNKNRDPYFPHSLQAGILDGTGHASVELVLPHAAPRLRRVGSSTRLRAHQQRGADVHRRALPLSRPGPAALDGRAPTGVEPRPHAPTTLNPSPAMRAAAFVALVLVGLDRIALTRRTSARSMALQSPRARADASAA